MSRYVCRDYVVDFPHLHEAVVYPELGFGNLGQGVRACERYVAEGLCLLGY